MCGITQNLICIKNSNIIYSNFCIYILIVHTNKVKNYNYIYYVLIIKYGSYRQRFNVNNLTEGKCSPSLSQFSLSYVRSVHFTISDPNKSSVLLARRVCYVLQLFKVAIRQKQIYSLLVWWPDNLNKLDLLNGPKAPFPICMKCCLIKVHS